MFYKYLLGSGGDTYLPPTPINPGSTYIEAQTTSATGISQNPFSYRVSNDGLLFMNARCFQSGANFPTWVQIYYRSDTSTTTWSNVSIQISTDTSINTPNIDINDAGNRFICNTRLNARVFHRAVLPWASTGNSTFNIAPNGYTGVPFSVAMSGDGNTIAIGGPRTISGGMITAGCVDIHTWSGSAWVFQTTLTDSYSTLVGGTASTMIFGRSLSFNYDGSELLIGQPTYNEGSTQMGKIFLFKKISGTWTYQWQVKGDNTNTGTYVKIGRSANYKYYAANNLGTNIYNSSPVFIKRITTTGIQGIVTTIDEQTFLSNYNSLYFQEYYTSGPDQYKGSTTSTKHYIKDLVPVPISPNDGYRNPIVLGTSADGSFILVSVYPSAASGSIYLFGFYR